MVAWFKGRVRTEEGKTFQEVAFESFPDSGGHNKENILVAFPIPTSKFALQGRSKPRAPLFPIK